MGYVIARLALHDRERRDRPPKVGAPAHGEQFRAPMRVEPNDAGSETLRG